MRLPAGPADLADGAVRDLRVCRHPCGVSGDYGPRADRVQGRRHLG